MRISDWSSDVCSSDLPETKDRFLRPRRPAAGRIPAPAARFPGLRLNSDPRHALPARGAVAAPATIVTCSLLPNNCRLWDRAAKPARLATPAHAVPARRQGEIGPRSTERRVGKQGG